LKVGSFKNCQNFLPQSAVILLIKSRKQQWQCFIKAQLKAPSWWTA